MRRDGLTRRSDTRESPRWRCATVKGWRRTCPDCGNADGARVERIAVHPTFRCECGHVWDGSGARLIGLWPVGGNTAIGYADLADAIVDEAQRRMST